MKLYKIVPMKQEITVHEYDGTYKQMRPLLPYDIFDNARITSRRDYLFLNDTGLLDGTFEKDGGFIWQEPGYPSREFVGEALLWGTDGEYNADPSLSVKEACERITFIKAL